MKKAAVIIIMILIGIAASFGLVIGAFFEIIEAVIGFVVWSVIILLVYVLWKVKT